MAVYADDGANNPGAYIASTSVSTVTANAWNTLPVGASLTAGTKYWLVYWTNSTVSPDNDLNNDTTPNSTVRHAYTSRPNFWEWP